MLPAIRCRPVDSDYHNLRRVLAIFISLADALRFARGANRQSLRFACMLREFVEDNNKSSLGLYLKSSCNDVSNHLSVGVEFHGVMSGHHDL